MASAPWKLLIVDDEKEIHAVTGMVLSKFRFEDRPLELLHAYSGEEAQTVLEEHPDIAVILLDIVMEHEDSGLVFVRYIRESMENRIVRIILRTGQPGQAPEQDVVVNYDIDDYKEKTELTAKKLVTTVITSLRAYMGLVTIAKLNEDLEAMVRARTAELQASLEVIRKDAEAGKVIQFKLLPGDRVVYEGYRFSHRIIPSLFLSGDFVDYFRIGVDHIGFYIADVAGHGASSAFITILLKSFVDTQKQRFASGEHHLLTDPSGLLSELNSYLLDANLGKHLTIFYGVIDPLLNTLSFANGGHYPFPLLVSGVSRRFLDVKGFPVGLLDIARYESSTLELPRDFLLAFFSDGLLEVIPRTGDQSDEDALNELIDQVSDTTEDVIRRLRLVDSDSRPDDLTFVLIMKPGAPDV